MSDPRLLLSLPQLPQDPASGAARSMSTICEMLAQAGFAVRAVGTTATERAGKEAPISYLRKLGISVQVEHGRIKPRIRPELTFSHRGVAHRLLDVGNRSHVQWESVHGRQFDLLFDDELHSFRPDILFTFGGSPGDRRRIERARRQGARIVFALRNENYPDRAFFDPMDGVLTPSRFLTDFYRERIGLVSTPLPLPFELEDVLAGEHDPIFFTMVNPSPEKGLMVLATLAEVLSVRRPDIPLLVIETRGSGGQLIQAGLAGGFDLRRHANIMVSGSVPRPRDIYVPTRVLLAPSLCREAAGRVVAEALLNGIPPIVSDRGGLAETANGAGFVLPIPVEVTPAAKQPVDAAVVEPWVALIAKLADDQASYERESERARQAGRIYLPSELAPRYVDYFRGFL
jgi:glycosyltransferase involved in cell wall biosynthesis